jgi:hypothetical protein
VWRWVLAAAFHVVTLIVILQLANSFFADTVKGIAENTLPEGIKMNDWLTYWDAGWGQAIQRYLILGAGVAFVVFIVWNIIFAIPSVLYKGGKMAKYLFFPFILIVLAGEFALSMLNNPVMDIDGQIFSLFVGNMTFYLAILAYAAPFVLSLAICSPYAIKSFKNWFTS